MKKGYYIVFGSQGSSGVNKKICMQMEEMKKHFKIELIEVPKLERSFFKRILGILPWISNNYDYNELFEKLENPDFIYIRAVLCDGKYIKFLERVNNKFANCKIVMEYPTYPYDKEHMQLSEIFFLLKDKYYRKFLHKVVDCFVTYTKHEKIFEVSTVQIRNGILVKEIEIAQKKRKDDKITLLAVGYLQKAHGYERCIKGLAQYYRGQNKREIHINIVGDGDELEYYKKIVDDNRMSQYVTFYGRKDGEELDRIYDEADIALGVFGLYKVGLKVSSALKIREYLAKGLPIISGCIEDVFENEETYFYYEFPNDSSIIDMNIVVDFYDKIYGHRKETNQIREEIRMYAYQTVDMPITFKNVIEYINN